MAKPTTKQPKTPLGRELSTLRRRANLSQRSLGKLSDLSWTYLQFIELGERGGKPINPSPLALKKIATGLAKDSIDGTVDQDRVDEIYQRLMSVAGYSPEQTDDFPTERDLVRYLTETLGPKDGQRVAEVIQALPSLSQQDRRAAIISIQSVVDVATRKNRPDLVIENEDGTQTAVEVKARTRRLQPRE